MVQITDEEIWKLACAAYPLPNGGIEGPIATYKGRAKVIRDRKNFERGFKACLKIMNAKIANSQDKK